MMSMLNLELNSVVLILMTQTRFELVNRPLNSNHKWKYVNTRSYLNGFVLYHLILAIYRCYPSLYPIHFQSRFGFLAKVCAGFV